MIRRFPNGATQHSKPVLACIAHSLSGLKFLKFLKFIKSTSLSDFTNLRIYELDDLRAVRVAHLVK